MLGLGTSHTHTHTHMTTCDLSIGNTGRLQHACITTEWNALEALSRFHVMQDYRPPHGNKKWQLPRTEGETKHQHFNQFYILTGAQKT